MEELGAGGLHVGGIVVNEVRDPILSDDDLDAIASGAAPEARAPRRR
jgi:hypothetical protein